MTDIVEYFNKNLDLDALEKAMADLPAQVEVKTDHHFSHGVYTRIMTAPAGTLIMGKRHRFETCNILLSGEISIYMGENEPMLHLKAPCVFNSKPGTKKLGYAHTEVVFANIHGTDETDVDKIENQFVVSEEEYLESQGGNICLG